MKKGLSARQREVVAELIKGQTNKQIAHRLGIGEGTVKMMLHLIYEKTGIHNRTALALWFTRPEAAE